MSHDFRNFEGISAMLSGAILVGCLGALAACGSDGSTVVGGSGGATSTAGASTTGSSAGSGGSSTTGAGGSGNPGGGSGTATTGVGGSAGSGTGGVGVGAGGTTTGTGGGNPDGGGAGTGPGGSGGAGGGVTDGGPVSPSTTVVILIIDGLPYQAVQTAVASGATNIKFLLDNGVRAELSHSSSPAVSVQLPDGTRPNGSATSGNTTVHTGTHLIDAPSAGMDDIFKATTAAGIKSIFVGNDPNYSIYTTATYHSIVTTDDAVMSYAIMQLKTNHVRLLRIHFQRIRDFWSGPAGMTDASSTYILHLLENDQHIGTLFQALKDEGVWDSTFFVLGSDHGMGSTTASAHVPSQPSSWNNLLVFYGPGLKKGATIPYAELMDVPVTAMRFFGLPPLKGHTAASVMLAQKGATGTFLSNLYAGTPADLPTHPRYVDQYLKTSFPTTDDFAPYRDGMIRLIR
jgi:hypothetical protein